jgi:CheY-specific phosphatase CheX
LTFEELGFVFPEQIGEVDPEQAKPGARVAIRFSGPFSGSLVLTIEYDALSAIASNMLGNDGLLEPEIVQDVLGELANVICGNALPEIGGKQSIFHLSGPEYQFVDPGQREPSAKAYLGLEEGIAHVSLYVN